MIDTVAIETERGTKPVTRARVDRATACFYPDSQRIIVVADRTNFEAAFSALTELAGAVLTDDQLEQLSDLLDPPEGQ